VNAKTTIRKILFIAIWLCIGGGMFTLLLAAISAKKKGHCADYTITLKGAKNHFFISEGEVEDILVKACGGALRGRSTESLNLNRLENLLEKNPWVSGAELYLDSRDVLHVVVDEKEPVARVFTVNGNSFYLDAHSGIMPLSDQRTAQVPVFTGFPDRKKYNRADSLLLLSVTQTATYILDHPFWTSQVAQIDISPEGNMEMIPVVGNHLVRLGDGENIPAKFNRLLVFYRQVLSKTGFDHYKLIDVQYKGQVVASRYAGDPRVDSVQLRKNVERLMKYAEEAAQDSTVIPLQPNTQLAADSTVSGQEDLPAEKTMVPARKKNPAPRPAPEEKQTVIKAEMEKAGTDKDKRSVEKAEPADRSAKTDPDSGEGAKKGDKKRVPKAVMPKRTDSTDSHGYQ